MARSSPSSDLNAVFQLCEAGIRLFVRVQPKAMQAEFQDVRKGADGRKRLHLRVRAMPDKGAANKDVCVLVAKASGLAKSQVEVVSGHTQREKTLLLTTDRVDRVLDALSPLVQDPRP